MSGSSTRDIAGEEGLRGVIPPIVTPLTAERAIDIGSLGHLIEFELAAGVSAIFALGTGGEGPYLDGPQRAEVTRAVVDIVAGRAPVLVGISDIGTARALRHLEVAVLSGADGLVCTAPFYGEVTAAEIEAHFRALARAAGRVPLYAYDIPSKVTVKIPTSTTVRLASEGVIRGIKDSSGDVDEFRRLKRDVAGLEHFSLITGSDSTADLALLEGADGMIAGMANVDPHGFVRLYSAAAAGNWVLARTEQERLFALRDIVRVGVPRIGPFSATIASFKAALVYRGIIASDALQLPLLELNSDERAIVGKMLTDFGLSRAT